MDKVFFSSFVVVFSLFDSHAMLADRPPWHRVHVVRSVSVETVLSPTDSTKDIYKSIVSGNYENAYMSFLKMLDNDCFPRGKIFNIIVGGLYIFGDLSRMPQMSVYTGLDQSDVANLKNIRNERFFMVFALIHDLVQQKTSSILMNESVVYGYFKEKLSQLCSAT